MVKFSVWQDVVMASGETVEVAPLYLSDKPKPRKKRVTRRKNG